MDFVESLKTLEAKVSKMESGELKLDDMIREFEEGQKLVAACQKELEAIRLKIEKVTNGGLEELRRDAEGKLKL